MNSTHHTGLKICMYSTRTGIYTFLHAIKKLHPCCTVQLTMNKHTQGYLNWTTKTLCAHGTIGHGTNSITTTKTPSCVCTHTVEGTEYRLSLSQHLHMCTYVCTQQYILYLSVCGDSLLKGCVLDVLPQILSQTRQSLEQ